MPDVSVLEVLLYGEPIGTLTLAPVGTSTIQSSDRRAQ
jgi:hypothetical protein